jgi:hypothetical protein
MTGKIHSSRGGEALVIRLGYKKTSKKVPAPLTVPVTIHETHTTSRRSPGSQVVFWLSLILRVLLNVCSQSQDKWTRLGGNL